MYARLIPRLIAPPVKKSKITTTQNAALFPKICGGSSAVIAFPIGFIGGCLLMSHTPPLAALSLLTIPVGAGFGTSYLAYRTGFFAGNAACRTTGSMLKSYRVHSKSLKK